MPQNRAKWIVITWKYGAGAAGVRNGLDALIGIFFKRIAQTDDLCSPERLN